MNKLLITLSIIFIFITLCAPLAHAGIVTGTLRYTRDWSDCTNGSRNACTETGTLKPLENVTVELLGPGGVLAQRMKTNLSGVYTSTNTAFMPSQGPYTLKVSWRDGTVFVDDVVDNLGDAHVALVAGGSGTPITTPLENVVISTPFSVPTGSGTVTKNYDVTSSSSAQIQGRARVYAMAYLQYRVWTTGNYVSTAFGNPGLPGWRNRIFEVSSAASGGSICLSSLDCVMWTRLSFATTNPFTMWHETGHGMQILAQSFHNNGQTWINTVRSGTCANTSFTASRALSEGWADFVWQLTKFSPTSIPPNPIGGGICSTCPYPVTGATPIINACGTGALDPNRSRVGVGLIDLVDSSQTASCNNETLQLSPGLLVDAVTFGFTDNNCYTGSCSGYCGTEEGGFVEGARLCSQVVSSPNWPYTGTRALLPEDQLSMLDLFGILKSQYGVNGTQLRNIWANTCWQPGDSAVQLP